MESTMKNALFTHKMIQSITYGNIFNAFIGDNTYNELIKGDWFIDCLEVVIENNYKYGIIEKTYHANLYRLISNIMYSKYNNADKTVIVRERCNRLITKLNETAIDNSKKYYKEEMNVRYDFKIIPKKLYEANKDNLICSLMYDFVIVLLWLTKMNNEDIEKCMDAHLVNEPLCIYSFKAIIDEFPELVKDKKFMMMINYVLNKNQAMRKDIDDRVFLTDNKRMLNKIKRLKKEK